ncbi:hypothetical protein SAMN05443247_06634 [Bradyrhizobium erythrophlei]|nr:hypothetical protein SAMN05443247_06634 [Bradyrhizobium erythrophlei]
MTSTTQSSQPVQNGGARPGAGRPAGSRSVRVVMREKLIAAYVDALGGSARVGPIVMQDIERAVDLVLLAREMRTSVRQGSAKVSDLTRLEGAADRAVRRLNLPAPGSAAPVLDLHDHVARRAAERANPPTEGD